MKRIYMIAGKARHGKDTTGSFIKEYYDAKGMKSINLQISYPLKYYASKVLDWDFSEETKPREFLQRVGSSIRSKMDERFFTNRLVEDIKVLFEFCDVIIISDVRMPIEFEEISSNFDDVKKVYINRPNFETMLSGTEQKHITETALDNYSDYDCIIKNDGSLEDLKNKVNELLEGGVL